MRDPTSAATYDKTTPGSHLTGEKGGAGLQAAGPHPSGKGGPEVERGRPRLLGHVPHESAESLLPATTRVREAQARRRAHILKGTGRAGGGRGGGPSFCQGQVGIYDITRGPTPLSPNSQLLSVLSHLVNSALRPRLALLGPRADVPHPGREEHAACSMSPC